MLNINFHHVRISVRTSAIFGVGQACYLHVYKYFKFLNKSNELSVELLREKYLKWGFQC